MIHKVVVAQLSDLATHQVLQVVTDWALAGLVAESVWIDLGNPSEVLLVSQEGTTKISTNDWLGAGVKQDDELRIHSLQVLRDAKNSLNFDDVQNALNTHPELSKVSGNFVNVIVPVSDLSKAPAETIFDYRLNVVVSPVDGMSPGTAHNLVAKKSAEVFSHAASALASIAGFWFGQTGYPLDKVNKNRVLGPGQNTIISRSFVRYVDASDLVKDLVDSVATAEFDLLPMSVDEKGSPFDVLAFGQAEAAVEEISKRFFTENQAQLAFKQPPAFRSGPLKKIGFVDAIKLYFSWVFKWLWQAPGEWAREKISNAKAVIASSGQRFLGSDSQYEVIVQGVSARSADSTSEMNLSQDVLEAARAGLGASNIAQPAAPQQLWESMVSATCYLADGGTALNALALPSIMGGDRLIIREASLLTPDANKNYFDVPATLPIAMSGGRLRADDPYSAFVVMDQIETALRNSAQISAVKFNELNQLKLELENWVRQNKSFVWLVGQKLALQLHKARVESRSMLMAASNLDSGLNLAEAETRARKALWNVVKGGIGILAASGVAWLVQAVILFFTSNAWPVLSVNWYLPALIVAGLLFIWNVIGLAAFNRAVGDFFDLEKKINEEKAKAKWAKENLHVVLQELHRLASLYGQYRHWVKVISPLFHRELTTKKKEAAKVTGIKNLADLPKSVVVATLSPSKEARAELFDRVRNSFYKRGWLKNTLDGYIGQRGFSISDIWHDNAQSQNSDLIKLSLLSNDSTSAAMLSDIEGANAKKLATQGTNYQHWTVRTNDAKFSQDLGGDRFVDALRRGEPSIPVAKLLSAKGNVQNIAEVSKNNSYFAHDVRLSGDADVQNIDVIKSSEIEERSLDFMAIRLELSELTSSDFIDFVEARVSEVTSEPSKKPTVEG